ncbi:hypothetical protein BJ138DRAFT_993281, partial [Hygrophoropsis aurantiaca]
GHRTPDFSPLLQTRLEFLKTFLWCYVDPRSDTYGCWGPSALRAANMSDKGEWGSRKVREWARNYVEDRENLPESRYGTWTTSRIDDEDFAGEILLHLQSIGKHVRAEDIVSYLDQESLKEKYQMKQTVSLATAKRWMKKLEYRWSDVP